MPLTFTFAKCILFNTVINSRLILEGEIETCLRYSCVKKYKFRGRKIVFQYNWWKLKMQIRVVNGDQLQVDFSQKGALRSA